MPQERPMHAAPSKAAAEPLRLERRKRRFPWAIPVVVFLLAAVLVTPAAMQYDSTHRASIECTVTEAKGKDHGRRHGGPVSQVVISTSDCGTLLMSKGITAENRDAKAAELTVGERYAFDIGESEHRFKWLMDLLNVAPDPWSATRVG